MKKSELTVGTVYRYDTGRGFITTAIPLDLSCGYRSNLRFAHGMYSAAESTRYAHGAGLLFLYGRSKPLTAEAARIIINAATTKPSDYVRSVVRHHGGPDAYLRIINPTRITPLR